MVHINKEVLNNIDFDNGYSQGKNWIGYFEQNKKFNIKYVGEAISFFCEFFQKEMIDLIVVESYYIDCDNLQKHIKNNVWEIENKLVDKGFIKTVNGTSFFSKNDEICDRQIRELDASFKTYSHNEQSIIEHLSFLGMVDSNVQGHCFFILKKDDLIIYPHGDNSGFGCIGISNRENEKAISFLVKASEKKNFNAYIYSIEKKQILQI